VVGAEILHVDMDAFYASVELVRRPELRGRPVIVGGSGQRGVVAAASYEARVFGVHSAMPSTQAARLCPDAVFLRGDHAHYAEVSGRVMGIFARYTPLVEPISLDEAFLDVSGARRLHGSPYEIATAVRSAVFEEEKLTCSVGIGPSKFVAKVATESAKPKPSAAGPMPGLGIKLVEPHLVQEFLDPLPIRAVWGVGPATEARLSRLGASTVADLRRLPLQSLVASLGAAQGRQLHDLANGRDNRNVEPGQAPKSISHEETFPSDLFEMERIEGEVVRMADSVGRRLRSAGHAGRTINLKVRFGDFTTITRSVTLDDATDTGTLIARAAKTLLRSIDASPGIRLLGVAVTSLVGAGDARQLSFDDLVNEEADWADTNAAIDSIRHRFGESSIGPASSLGAEGLRAKRRGEQQWGPSQG
jgi:DNA polymerase IV